MKFLLVSKSLKVFIHPLETHWRSRPKTALQPWMNTRSWGEN